MQIVISHPSYNQTIRINIITQNTITRTSNNNLTKHHQLKQQENKNKNKKTLKTRKRTSENGEIHTKMESLDTQITSLPIVTKPTKIAMKKKTKKVNKKLFDISKTTSRNHRYTYRWRD